jgi:hypothetical protein
LRGQEDCEASLFPKEEGEETTSSLILPKSKKPDAAIAIIFCFFEKSAKWHTARGWTVLILYQKEHTNMQCSLSETLLRKKEKKKKHE